MKERLTKILQQIEKLGGDARPLIFEAPVSFDDIYVIEQQLNYKIPDDFKNALLTLSSHCEFKWFLPDNFQLPNELKQIFSGELHWGIDFILDFNESKDGWIKEVFPAPENEYDRIWHNKFVFQEVGNGDYISVDLSPETYGKVIYLSHDDGEGHGYIMANSFSELLNNWTQLGCVGGEDWQWLPFCEDTKSGIDPTCANALLWRQTIMLT
jgi:cell wall assembly regulator SMI1